MQTIKTINDFTIAVHTALAAAFPGYQIEPVNVTANNDIHLTGVKVMPQNNKIAPAIFIDPYFENLKSGQPLIEVINQIISICTDALSCTDANIDVGNITDFEQIKDKICYKLIGRDKNSEFLSTVPHRDYMDLSIVYYIYIVMADNGLATINVSDILAKVWNVDEETLYNLAHTNTPKINRGCVKPITDILNGVPGCLGTHNPSTYKSFDFTSTRAGELPMYVATNQNKTFGTAILLYDRFLDAAAKEFGSYYVLPASVHELIIVPETFGNPSELKQLVKRVNNSEVPEQEILSDNIFHYNAQTHKLEIVV